MHSRSCQAIITEHNFSPTRQGAELLFVAEVSTVAQMLALEFEPLSLIGLAFPRRTTALLSNLSLQPLKMLPVDLDKQAVVSKQGMPIRGRTLQESNKRLFFACFGV